VPYKVADQLAWQLVGDEAVIVDLDGGRMLGLSAVASFIWPRLETHDENQLVDAITGQFEVSDDQARADVERFLAELREKQLLQSQ
jgi:hypothetical protein